MGMAQRRRYSRQSTPAQFDPDEAKFYVYRLLDAENLVLYVGRSFDPEMRLRQHRASTDWASAVTRIETRGPYTWARVVEEEREQIERDLPIHNRHFVKPPRRAAS